MAGGARLPGFLVAAGVGGDRQDQSWYDRHGITFKASCRVDALDVGKKRLETVDGTSYTYGNLVLATGARALSLSDLRITGAVFSNVVTLREVEDAERLVSAIERAKEAKAGGAAKAVVVGGGYIGLEVGAALVDNGLDVTILAPEGVFVPRALDAKLSAPYERAFADRGARVLKGESLEAVISEGGDEGAKDSASSSSLATAVELKSGTRLEADLVVVGVGARPRVELAEGQLSVLSGPPGGVAVTSHLEAEGASGVYAIGDIAAFPLDPEKTSDADRVRQEHVTHARLSAAYVAREILGASGLTSAASADQGPYRYLPFFYSRFFDFSWQLYGTPQGDAIHFEGPGSKGFGAVWADDQGRVVAGFLESGTPEQSAEIRRLVEERAHVPATLKTEGADAFFRTKTQ